MTTADPLLLAIDTTGPHCAAALMSGDLILAQAETPMAKGQTEHLMGFCAEILTGNGSSWRDLDFLAVGTGPGNFTGLRISVSAVRGLALGLEIPAIGISNLEAQVFGFSRPTISTLDARRDGLYFQSFNCGTDAQPMLCDLETLPSLQTRLVCVGHRADEVAHRLSGEVAEQTLPLAETIARTAYARRNRFHPRPAPLYIRPADAAPARDKPPVILP